MNHLETQKRRWLIAVIVVSLLPIPLIVHFPSGPSAKQILLTLSAMAGYMGIVLLLWMYILGAKSVMSVMFKDLAPVLKIHQWLGKYGAVAILLHPILIIYSYGESWLYGIVPHVSSHFERIVTFGRISFGLFVIVWVSSTLLRNKIGYRPWKYIHYLAYICLPFALLHVPAIGSQYMSSTFVKVYYLTLISTAGFFFLIRLRGLLNIDKEKYVVSRIEPISEGTSLLTVSPHNARLKPMPGQYVYVKLGYISEDHPYSIVDYNQKTGEISIAFRVSGRYSKALNNLSVGQEVFLGGPFGTFTSNILRSDKPLVFIAGGIGITPFISHIFSENSVETWLFYANQNESRSAFRAQLKSRLGARCVELFNQSPAQASSAAPSIITNALLTQKLNNIHSYDFYICGPEPFMKAVTQSLNELGVAPTTIYNEEFSF